MLSTRAILHSCSHALSVVLVTSILLGTGYLPATAESTESPSAPLTALYQTLPFSQDWSNKGMITTDDNWSGVPGVTGYLGDYAPSTQVTNIDPRTLLEDYSSTTPDVIANQTITNAVAGGVAEFELANPVVALQGSGSADAPFILIHINTSGFSDIQVQYLLRDVDTTIDNAVQQVVLQYRVGETGPYDNVSGSYVADATAQYPATKETPINVVLPANANNQPMVQLRIMTTNATSNDEWVGIDDIGISGSPLTNDLPPSIFSTSPTNLSTDVLLNANLSITFTEPVQVADGWLSLSCSLSGSHPVSINTTDQIKYTIDPLIDYTSSDICTATIDHTKVNEVEHSSEVMLSDYIWSFTVVQTTCSDPFIPIHSIQGSGNITPSVGSTHVVEGIVTGDFQAPGGLGGFFMQANPIEYDSDPHTSEGIFVYNNTFTVSPGDRVRFYGTVAEYNELTELKDVTDLVICSSGNSLPPATILHLPLFPGETLEPYEGMKIMIAEPLTVSQNFFLGRYGQVTLSAGGRMYTPTNGQSDTFEFNTLRSIILDDDSSVQNPNTVPYLGTDGTLRQGDSLAAGLTGYLDQYTTTGPTSYRLQPVSIEEIRFTRDNLRPSTPDPTSGSVSVAGFNIHNYFTTLNPPGRGARTEEELTRQTTKLVAALKTINADVFALIEIENNGTTAIQYLVDHLNMAAGEGTYAVVADPINGVGSDAIKNVLIYKPTRVTLVGPSVSPDNGSAPYTIFKRLPVAQTFDYQGEHFTVIANHFKSKGCDAGATGLNADQGDGQGCYNETRFREALALADFISQVQTAQRDADVLVMGDLNAYGLEDPIDALKQLGMTDEVAKHVSLPDRYSYTFDGASGYLDHVIATDTMDGQVTGVDIWHINADEPNVLNFETQYNPPSLYQANAYRSSDHDPVVVELDLYTSYSLALDSTLSHLSGFPGQTITYTLLVSNTGTAAQTFTISVGTSQWKTTAPTSIPVWPGYQKDFSVEVSIPTNAPAGERDTVLITVTSQQDPTATASILLTTTNQSINLFLPTIRN